MDWLDYRKRGVGASDVGTILGMNPYKSSIELFYERLQPTPALSVENIAMFMGHEQEDFVANLWQYWGGTTESLINNYRNGIIVRRCQRVNGYVQNPDYPWLFVSLDRKINKGNNGEEGALEIKTIAGYEADKWEAGIPTPHIVQVMTQMLVCEFGFGEIAALRDGRNFDVYPFTYNENIAKQIIERTKAFWDKVQRGRVLLTQQYEAERNFNQRKANELQAELESLEPEPDGTEAYEKFLKSKFKKSMAEVGLIKGTDADFKRAVELVNIKAQIKSYEDKAREQSNHLKRRIGDGLKLDFGKAGYISWQGDPRTFLIRIKQ